MTRILARLVLLVVAAIAPSVGRGDFVEENT
jgi:hypothetical protein